MSRKKLKGNDAMEQEWFEWKSDYEIGVPIIDNAHRQLFAIVSRILRNFVDGNFEKNKTTCIEAIKYLKSYTVKHFIEEEAYQREISYAGYENHKKVHDNMREVVIPALERELTANCYSLESMQHFAGACAGWLAAHVLIEDQAITGKVRSKWSDVPAGEDIKKLGDIFKTINDKSLHIPVTLMSEKYTGHRLDDLFCYRDRFRTGDFEEYTVITAIERPLLSKLVLDLLNVKIFDMDEVVSPMVNEMCKALNRDIVSAFLGKTVVNVNSAVLPEEDFYGVFKESYPSYSTLWRARDNYIVLVIDKKSTIGGK